ncbi:MAG: TIGR00282 family metallophosphoesterase [Candidatus Cloacimonetes bacterium]|nr:TIGR00282 family metallophosphoesterase [Candidatus Cloacimonadota bacterium]
MIKILFIGDIYGKPGRKVVSKLLPKLKAEENFDLVIANGENLAGGLGITPKTAKEMFDIGINVFTSGNHLWDKKEIIDFLTIENRILKPANYPPEAPGNDFYIFETYQKVKIGILNLMGRAFTVTIDCPFRTADEYLKKINKITNIVILDFHAEATAEKMALAWYLDGKVSAIVGTHTHVPTADERILPQGTAYITDVGMTGSHDSVIGLRIKDALERFITQIPVRFHPAKENLKFNGFVVTIDEKTGKANDIKRLSIPLINDETNIPIYRHPS